MGKKSLWFFEKMTLGLMVTGKFALALEDDKLSLEEGVDIGSTLIAGFLPDFKMAPNDLTIAFTPEGGLGIMLSPAVVERFKKGLK